MQHVQVPLVDVAGDEDVHRLGLADLGRAVRRQLDDPALVDLEGGLVDVLLVLAEEVEVLDRAFLLQDRGPHRVGVLALLGEQALQVRVLDREGARQGLVAVDIGRDRLDAGARAAADDRDRGGRRDGQLVGEALHDAPVGGVGAGPALFGQDAAGLVGLAAQVLEDAHVPGLGQGGLEGHVLLLQERVEAHQAQANRPLSARRIDGGAHFRRRALDEVLQHVVEEAHDVLDEQRVVAPLVVLLGVDRRQAADGGALVAQVVGAGVQHDFRAQVGLGHLQPQLALMLGHGPVHGVGEDQVGLAGLQADLEDLLPQGAGVDEADDLVVLGAAQAELGPVADGFHELVGDRDAVVQVQGLAVEVARRLADLEELFDLGVVDVEIDGRRAAAQRALGDGQRQRIHDADEGDDARGLARALHLLADGADLAPVGADAAAVGGQRDVLVPGADD